VFRKKTNDTDENTCPLCSLPNPLDAESCSRCYYDFTVSVHQQSRKSDDAVVGSLLDELTSGIEDDEQDEADVDWTNHSFDMSDFSVDVAEYDDSDDVIISHSTGFARQLVSDDDIKNDVSEDEFELSLEDAPSSVEKFIVPEGHDDDLSIPEPTKIKLVDPISSTEQEMDADLLNDDWSVSDSAPILVSEDQDISPPPIIVPPLQSTESTGVAQVPSPESALPPMPNMPQQKPEPIPVVPQPTPTSPVSAPSPAFFENTPPAPQPSATMPMMPSLPSGPKTTPVPTIEPISIVDANIWPWNQGDPWDDRVLASRIKEAMEAAKSDRKEEAAKILDEIGPHLSDRYRLMLYVGALLKNLGRDDELQSMLQAARNSNLEDTHVQAALKQLG